jgi:enediyne polyketide synthase
VDIEPVELRDTETWKGLLGDDGYLAALELQRETGESFDVTATRLWTLIEAERKAGTAAGGLPRLNGVLESGWVVFRSPSQSACCVLSAALQDQGREFVLSLAGERFSLSGESGVDE